MLKYHLRHSTPEDFEFVFQLNKINMRHFVEQIRGWDEEAERKDMRRKFLPFVDQIIQVNGIDVGIFSVEQRQGEIYLKHIEILPEYQGQGIGGSLIRSVQSQAMTQGLSVKLTVLKANSAKQIYERLGFRVIQEYEKNGGIKCDMLWKLF